jgi:hypothetical protein
MVYGLFAGNPRRQTTQCCLETIGIGNTGAGESDQLSVTTKANLEMAESATQRIAKRSLFVTGNLDPGWFVDSFDEGKLIWIGAD